MTCGLHNTYHFSELMELLSENTCFYRIESARIDSVAATLNYNSVSVTINSVRLVFKELISASFKELLRLT